ncbi:DJ-1/PfpI family protein [Candidatus Micrarchaeota archaeon]|nr:DJ-1/PfpI family protein [Candidatus Micrarchaeota archaeon]
MRIHILMFAILLLGCAQQAGQKASGGEGMRKVLFVIAPSDFRDEELFHSKEAVESAGFRVYIASTSMNEAVGMLGGRVKPDLLVSQANLSQYDAVVFIGGQGVETNGLPENPAVVKLAKDASSSGKVVAAVCIAPRILAAADIVRGRNVTSFPDNDTISSLKRAGAVYTGKPVERDGKLVTADGPSSAKGFGEEIVKVLGG